ncbi:WecB/TagA/CpsF family glycosyltransferase [Pseudothermotoga thermarum]|uniref:N-acetylmannosaminyltransferase n=1 Tax=Pseudothermotoga thermarum DSM 5069 TaxID=688269 RepID=F7YXV3_9THEM|nr:WecB/TagA/CpsF family glycosyltransferase [Pseudothermotoga thermarum]AEH50752.1 N-acetylmannosaminyltransferase [Pseudothermotoga thermarum DSM 5069]
MNLKFVELFDLPIAVCNEEELIEYIVQRINNRQKTFAVSANASIMVRACENELYKAAVKSADLIFPDGSGVVWAIKKLYDEKAFRITGIDTMLKLCKLSPVYGWKVFLLGARQEVVEKAAKNLSQKYGAIICGYHHGYFNGPGPIEMINESKADIIFVGMGVPKQELWIKENFFKTTAVFAMGVGGSFDVIGEKKKRAPEWIQKAKLEWLYRFLQSPLEKKNVPGDVLKFLILVHKYRNLK